MLKLFLPFFTISIFIGKSEPRKLNPNIATFEELLSIPIITEEEALAIMTARTVKEFKSITDLIERTGLDTAKVEALQEIFIFKSPEKYNIQIKFWQQHNAQGFYSKFTSSKYFGSFYTDRNFLGAYLGNNWITIGKFDLQISPYTLNPVFYPNKGNFNLCLNRPLTVAIGLHRLKIGVPLHFNVTHILISPVFVHKERADFQIFARSKIEPITFYTFLSSLNKTAVLRLHFKERNVNLSAQAKLVDKKFFVDFGISRAFQTGNSFYLKLSNKEFDNASYLQYSQTLPSGCAFDVRATLTEKYPEIYSVKIYSRNLSIQYLKGQTERIALSTFYETINLKVFYFPTISAFEYRVSGNFAIHSMPFKIAIGWKDKKSWNVSLELKINAEKGQGDNFEDR